MQPSVFLHGDDYDEFDQCESFKAEFEHLMQWSNGYDELVTTRRSNRGDLPIRLTSSDPSPMESRESERMLDEMNK